MRPRSAIGACLVGGAALALAATLFGDQVASARSLAQSVIVSNAASQPVPVHEQGTVSVSGSVGLVSTANTVKLDSAANRVTVGPANAWHASRGPELSHLFGRTIDASLIVVDFVPGASALVFENGDGNTVFALWGPAATPAAGKEHLILPLTQPVRMDRYHVICAEPGSGGGSCQGASVSLVGTEVS